MTSSFLGIHFEFLVRILLDCTSFNVAQLNMTLDRNIVFFCLGKLRHKTSKNNFIFNSPVHKFFVLPIDYKKLH